MPSAPAAVRRRGRRNWSSWSGRLVETGVLDLVEERLVTDAEDLRGLFAVPARLLQHAEDEHFLGFARGDPGDVLEGRVGVVGRRGLRGRRVWCVDGRRGGERGGGRRRWRGRRGGNVC